MTVFKIIVSNEQGEVVDHFKVRAPKIADTIKASHQLREEINRYYFEIAETGEDFEEFN